MDECFKCGKDADNTLLYDVISNEGIKKICRHCISEENLPVIRKPANLELSKEKPEQQSVYQRLSKAAGLDPEKHRQRKTEPEEAVKKQEELRELANKRFIERVPAKQDKVPEGLVEHFHWKLMRQRRLRKISQKELAERIREPEEAIKMLEKGIVPEDYLGLIRKIEKSLGIELFKLEFRERIDSRLPGYIDFENRDFDNLTIADLKEIKKSESDKTKEQNFEEDFVSDEEDSEQKEETEKKGFRRFFKRKKKETPSEEERTEDEEESEGTEKTSEKREVSQKEINDIIYGNKR